MASIDLEEYKDADFTVGCEIPDRCGIGLNRYGYYACCPGANCDRVFGFDIGLKSLSDVNEEALKKQRNILCKYCGYFKVCNPLVLKKVSSCMKQLCQKPGKKCMKNIKNKNHFYLYIDKLFNFK